MVEWLIHALHLVSSALILFGLLYGFAMFIVSRGKQRVDPASSRDLFFVFIVPCLNEQLVISRSLDALLSIPCDNFAVLVVDDASQDATAEIVRRYDPERVWLLQRALPDARQGKGEALNAGYDHLKGAPRIRGRDPHQVVLVVVDADGRIESNAPFAVAPYFSDPRVGAVQVAVRIYNARENLLARFQDFEFVVFQEIFQRAREKLGSVGLGGNGQFTRLSALQSLGDRPWTRCLT